MIKEIEKSNSRNTFWKIKMSDLKNTCDRKITQKVFTFSK